jgi:hypothetical protein
MAPFVLEIIQFYYFRVLTKFLISPTEFFCQKHIEIRNMQKLGLNPSQPPIIPLMHIGTGVKINPACTLRIVYFKMFYFLYPY